LKRLQALRKLAHARNFARGIVSEKTCIDEPVAFTIGA